MNYILILEPRWRDRTVLIADHKIGKDNMVTIKHKEYPQPFYISGEIAKSYPLEMIKTKRGSELPVRAVPLLELQREVML